MKQQEIKQLHELLAGRRCLLRLRESLILQLVETKLKLDAIEESSACAADLIQDICRSDYSPDEEGEPS